MSKEFEMNRMKTILIALATFVVALIVSADTNVIVATAKCPQATSASVGVPVSDAAVSRELKAGLKEAEVAAEAAVYEKRYRDLKVAHDDFMCHVSVLVAILGIAAATIGIGGPILQWKYKGDIDKTKRRIDNLV